MRIVVKVGTSTLAYPTGRMNIRHTEGLVKVLSDLKNAGHEVILVSSGAIGMGVGKLSLPARPTDMASKQACAAVGQCELMYTYDRLFNAYNHTVAQILLTGVDVEHNSRRVNFENTLHRLLELGALPIINENDSVATDEITSIGDNDTLAAIVTCCARADLLVLLSDIDGLYTANPHTHPEAQLIPLVEQITPEILALADGAGSALGHRRHGHQAPGCPGGHIQKGPIWSLPMALTRGCCTTLQRAAAPAPGLQAAKRRRADL